jgi:hypothetical protein
MQDFFCNEHQQLDTWMCIQPKDNFPYIEDYPSRYNTICDSLKRDIFRDIERGALADSLKKGQPPAYLNNHSLPHVQQVIKRITDILKATACRLSSYESFLLLTAVLFHDAGNILGREDHEKGCLGIMRQLGVGLFPDAPEMRVIAKIAAAHGGFINGNKDTLSELTEDYSLRNETVRKRLLASLLRFADELADDCTRASRFMFDHKILEGSEAYHAYSLSLKSVKVEREAIGLRFEFDKKSAISQFMKVENLVFLFDEILERTLKMHLERIYCMRYCRPYIDIKRINVTIEVYESFETGVFVTPLWKVEYSLTETGYPTPPPLGIYALCQNLQGLDGPSLKLKMEKVKPRESSLRQWLRKLWKK